MIFCILRFMLYLVGSAFVFYSIYFV
ncbi:hypothetical protein CGLO_16977 [Colletotrichum gloeosporioides Cg-14]|uniref:Uncharacterized protein n=1 Tax=Colletotrichum gloeosporioides (strain Cg-14) TaxID=1237896 RepID=T0JXR4_COLGC|nr:hypothetical protein CGLO_16977 [Colletotrichum gloeosporioides Cg-14]